jgi:hypothetical protein
MRTLGGSDFVWAQVLETSRIDDQTISPGEVADFCSLLSVAGVLWPVVKSGAVLLALTATMPPPPLRRADASVSIPVRLARYPRQREESFSRTAFNLMALIVVGAVECGLTELLARRDEHRHVN